MLGVLRQAAEQDRRSLNQEAIYLLTTALQQRLQQTEVSQYVQAYRQNPESADEMLALSDSTNQILSELAWA